MSSRLLPLFALSSLAACGMGSESTATLYDSAVVERRDIVVAVEAAGTLEPVATIELKSKASGEILSITAETGDVVAQGAELVRIDPRTARNRLSQAEADLEAARARLSIARAQQERAATLRDQGVLSKTDYETTALELATAQAQRVAAEVSVENARIALADTVIRAPAAGTIIEKQVEQGQVISSPTQDVGGGTLLLRMADLAHVQVRVLVDETDIGKIRPGMASSVRVSAYPNQPFHGEVLKIEPQAVVEQNVTLFGVLVSIDNREGLLKPGMNSEVTITVARAEAVLALPVAALRTNRDLPTTAQILGIDEAGLREQLAAAAPAASEAADAARPREGAARPREGAARNARPDGYQFGSRFWVVVQRGAERVPVAVQTGLTDLDRAEIVAGLAEGDAVLLLPSAHLMETQQELQSFITRRIGGVPGIGQR
jgi:HlyD family secretion protein